MALLGKYRVESGCSDRFEALKKVAVFSGLDCGGCGGVGGGLARRAGTRFDLNRTT
jgi:hypothetical protein